MLDIYYFVQPQAISRGFFFSKNRRTLFGVQTAIRQKAPPLGCSGQTIQPIRLKFEREHEIVKILTFRLINLFLNQIL